MADEETEPSGGVRLKWSRTREGVGPFEWETIRGELTVTDPDWLREFQRRFRRDAGRMFLFDGVSPLPVAEVPVTSIEFSTAGTVRFRLDLHRFVRF